MPQAAQHSQKKFFSVVIPSPGPASLHTALRACGLHSFHSSIIAHAVVAGSLHILIAPGDCWLTGAALPGSLASPQSLLCLNGLWLWHCWASFPQPLGYTCFPCLWVTPGSSSSPTLYKHLLFLYSFCLGKSSLSEIQPSFLCLMSWKSLSPLEHLYLRGSQFGGDFAPQGTFGNV